MSALSQQARRTLAAVEALKLGRANAFENGTQAVFTIVMDHAPSATEHRLKRLAGRVEAQGYRVTAQTINDATLRVDARPSVRNVGTVTRVARDGDATIMLLGGTLNAGLWRIADAAASDRDALLLTQVGDEVELWRDVTDGLPAMTVSTMRNRTLPAIPS